MSAAAATDGVIRAACSITDASASCYTASWYLIWDQVRYWLLFQAPIISASVVFEWLELSSLPHIERLRAAFDSPLTRAANNLLQIVTCAYVCIAWIVRGGSLAVSFSSWSVESALLIATAVGYGIRWVAARQKVRFTLQLHSLFDLLSIVSHFAISFQTITDGGSDQPRRSWLDFGFLRSYIAYVVIDHLFARYRYKTFAAQVLLVVFKALCLVFIAACVLFSLERLGDIPYTDSFLLHVYKCSSADGTQTILFQDASGTDVYPDCSETWSVFSSIYFMFVTVSTVGYGDFSPKTVLGQLTVCGVIVFGIYTFAHESAAFMTLFSDQRGARVKYNVSRSTAHVIVTGNPSATQMKDFIREFFHPDHDVVLLQGDWGDGGGANSAAAPSQDDVEDGDVNEDGLGGARATASNHHTLEEGQVTTPSESGTLAGKWRERRSAHRVRETHIVVLLRFDSDAAQTAFQHEVSDFVADNPRYHKRVFLIYGSPLRKSDLLDRAKLRQARAVFFLPNKFANDGHQEDAATVLRVLAVTQHRAPDTQLFAMLVNSENRTLLEATGMTSDHLVCADELRLGLMGLSCRCPGLSTLVSNLITSRSGDILTNSAATGDGSGDDHQQQQPWLAEYVAGAANEIYACALAPQFASLTFTAAAQRIHTASQGLVLLIAVEIDSEVAFNPGRRYRLPPACRAYFIAESMASLTPFAAPPSLLRTALHSGSGGGTLAANLAVIRARSNLVARARRAQHTVERRIPAHVRASIHQCSASSVGGGGISAFEISPSAPPHALLARGGHIVVCSNVAADGGGQRSVARLVNFLKPLRAPHIERLVPVVLVDAERLDGVSWLQLRQFGEVYHVQGSPQRHSVLVAAGVYSASAIVVLAQGTEAGYDDSKAIFNAVLVNSALQRSAAIFTIIELRDVHNNRFLDPVASFSSRQFDDLDVDSDVGSVVLGDAGGFSPRLSRGTTVTAARRGSITMSVGRKSSNAPHHRTWFEQQAIACHSALLHMRAFFLGNLLSAAHRVQAFQHSGDGDAVLPPGLNGDDSVEDDDTFFQERFMRGALFPSYVADDLLIQSFFNPSLNVFVRKILDGTSCFMLYDIPQQWRRAPPPTYGALFAYMTSGVAHALPIGLLRARGGATGAPYPYVYTCPAAATLVYPEDKLFVLIDVHALHRVANTLQRRFRNRRKAVKDLVTVADTVDAAVRRASGRMPVNQML